MFSYFFIICFIFLSFCLSFFFLSRSLFLSLSVTAFVSFFFLFLLLFYAFFLSFLSYSLFLSIFLSFFLSLSFFNTILTNESSFCLLIDQSTLAFADPDSLLGYKNYYRSKRSRFFRCIGSYVFAYVIGYHNSWDIHNRY